MQDDVDEAIKEIETDKQNTTANAIRKLQTLLNI
jgi:uncharacterized protein YdcH (DUF465 family)